MNRRFRAYLPSIVLITASIVSLICYIVLLGAHFFTVFLSPLAIVLYTAGIAWRPKTQVFTEKRIYWTIVLVIWVAAIVASTLINRYG